MHALSWSYIKEKWSHAGFQKYFRNTGWMLSSRVISMILTFITTTIIARKLGPENLGQLNYAISFASIFLALAPLGLDSILYRDILNYREKRNVFLGSAFLMRLVWGIVLAIALSLCAVALIADPLSKVLVYIIASTLVLGLFQITSIEFQAQTKAKYLSLITIAISLILNTTRILLVVSGKGVLYLALALVLESILYSGLYLFYYHRALGERISHWRFDWSIARSLLSDAWPLILVAVFSQVYARIDQVFIKHMLDTKSVGIYSAGVTLAEVWYFIPTAILISVFPAIVNAKKTSPELYYLRLRRAMFLLIGLAILISLAVTVLAPFLMHIIFGSAFTSGSIVLQIYVWACVGTFLGYLVDNYLVVENQKKTMLLKAFVPMALNIALNLLWIPKYGIMGAAFATLVSYSIAPLTVLLTRSTRLHVLAIFR